MPTKPAEPKPDARLAAAEDLVRRYLEAHGSWREETHRGNNQTTVVRVLVPCECPVCTDARAHLGEGGSA